MWDGRRNVKREGNLPGAKIAGAGGPGAKIRRLPFLTLVVKSIINLLCFTSYYGGCGYERYGQTGG